MMRPYLFMESFFVASPGIEPARPEDLVGRRFGASETLVLSLPERLF
jgi:hypothetical protein